MSDPIKELRALYEAGTKGPWGVDGFVVRSQDCPVACTSYQASDRACHANADLIVAMHRHLPALLDLASFAVAIAPQIRATERILYKRWLEANDDITHKAWGDAQKIALGLEAAIEALTPTERTSDGQ